MKKTLFVITAFIGTVIMSLAFTKENAPPSRYKNLKVLPKNTTKEQMDSVMKHFSASLGVRCNYCHVFNQEQKAMDFASDGNKNKNIARDMWHMTAKLNKKYFDVKDSKDITARLEVSCYTCHHGAEHPATKAPAQQGPQGGQRPQGPPPAGAQAGTDSIRVH